METIQLIADSCCDCTPKLQSQMDLKLVPLKITIDGQKTYVDDENIDIKALLLDMKETKRPLVTSAPAPEEYAWLMRQAKASLVVTLSSKLSGSYNSAVAARDMVLEEYPDKKIFVVDSKTASAGELRIALKLHSLIKKGLPFENITKEISAFVAGMKTLFVLDDLTTLIKNGRIPKMKGMLASILMFRPIMGENGEGEIIQIEKVRGSIKALARLVEIIAERTATYAEKSLCLTLSYCNNLERAIKLKKELADACPAVGKIVLCPTSGLSTSYANSGGLIVAYA